MEKFLTVKEIVKTSLNPEQEQKNLVVSSLVLFSISLVFFFFNLKIATNYREAKGDKAHHKLAPSLYLICHLS